MHLERATGTPWACGLYDALELFSRMIWVDSDTWT